MKLESELELELEPELELELELEIEFEIELEMEIELELEIELDLKPELEHFFLCEPAPLIPIPVNDSSPNAYSLIFILILYSTMKS